MRIYLFRHGEAVPKDDPSVASDPERPLIEEGIKRTRQSAEGLKQLGTQFDAVFTSPWRRAQQTAQIICDVLAIADHLHEMPELAGDRTVQGVIKALVKEAEIQNVMLVGHNPLLTELASHLISNTTGVGIDLRKSGVCAIDIDRVPPQEPGTLLWLMTPRQLRAMR